MYFNLFVIAFMSNVFAYHVNRRGAVGGGVVRLEVIVDDLVAGGLMSKKEGKKIVTRLKYCYILDYLCYVTFLYFILRGMERKREGREKRNLKQKIRKRRKGK